MRVNLKILVLAALVLALLIPTFAVSAKTFKFTFDNVTFSDGTQGDIEAGSKQTGNGSTVTVCSYYTSEHSSYLGQFQDDAFFSSDAEGVEAFCLANFANRTP